MRSLIPRVMISYLLLATSVSHLNDFQIENIVQNVEAKQNWIFVVDRVGHTTVTVFVSNAEKLTLGFHLPKTYTNLTVPTNLNWNIREGVDSSFDSLTMSNIPIENLRFTFDWPDGAVLFKGSFYFAGQEKFQVGPGNVTIVLPESADIQWVEENEYVKTNEPTLIFVYDQATQLPSVRYSLKWQQVEDVYKLKTSNGVNLFYHPATEGKPWIEKTIKLTEENWPFLRTTLNGTLQKVNITFAPYGYNDLGTKFAGFCYYNSREVQIVATIQFGIGLGSYGTTALFHELTHAFTPLLEDLPSFYSEGIAETTSYLMLRKLGFNNSANSFETSRFLAAYDGVKSGLLNYTWFWKWNSTIYDNPKIMESSYGVSTFLGDYLIYQWGYSTFNKLNAILNKTEIDVLKNENQRFAKFIHYLSLASKEDVSPLFENLAELFSQWYDTYRYLIAYSKTETIGPITWLAGQYAQRIYTEAYGLFKEHDYGSALNKATELTQFLDSFWIWELSDVLFYAALLLFVTAYIVRRRRESDLGLFLLI